ncbi:MAG: hypothetical protein DRN30_06810 [Thermoplasmata archaeon]|nr:MAG: hypothetical protein DRN30_06810 [Thermoplasmata archaeon]
MIEAIFGALVAGVPAVKKLIKDKKGASVVITALTLAVVLFVAAIVMSQLGGQATTIAQQMNDTGAINYIENVKSMSWNAFYLFAIAIIILAAAFIIRIVQGMGGGSVGP